MDALERLTTGAAMNEPDVEWVVQHPVECVHSKRTAAAGAKPTVVEVPLEGLQSVKARCVEFEGDADQRSAFRVGRLRPSSAAVDVPERRSTGENSLSEPSSNTLQGFEPEIPYVVRGGDDRLDVGGEPPATGGHIERLGGEVHGNLFVDQVSEVCPVLHVSSTPLDLVNDQPGRSMFAQQAKDFCKDRSSSFRGGLAFFKPMDDGQVVLLGEPRDRIALLLQ